MTPDARHRNLLVSFVRNCKSQLRQSKVADTTGVELSAGKLLTAVLIFRRLLLREVLGPEEKFVGLLLPPSAGAAKLALAGKSSTASKTKRENCARSVFRFMAVSRYPGSDRTGTRPYPTGATSRSIAPCGRSGYTCSVS